MEMKEVRKVRLYKTGVPAQRVQWRCWTWGCQVFTQGGLHTRAEVSVQCLKYSAVCLQCAVFEA